jgi:hypothetical protein
VVVGMGKKLQHLKISVPMIEYYQLSLKGYGNLLLLDGFCYEQGFVQRGRMLFGTSNGICMNLHFLLLLLLPHFLHALVLE